MSLIRGLILFSLVWATGCAYLVKSERQQVFFNGGPSEGKTVVQTPDGKFEIENGTGSYLMTRSRSNVPLKVTCPDGKTKESFIETKFDWLAGGAGNILNGGWGWLVDPFANKAFDYPSPVSLYDYCKQ